SRMLQMRLPWKALHYKWIGPFTLDNSIGENAFHVKLLANWKLWRVHNVSRLKPSTIDHSGEQDPA
ncbi:hypothetical protein K440DRAFT_480313, partial [Wilcoxina mikolae CBS 423.85]